MSAPELPYVADIVPGLRGRGVVLADTTDFADVALTLLTAGYTVREIEGADLVDRRHALPALAHALGLRGAADRNLDALADTLRDLPEAFPRERGVALLWRAAEQFMEGDAGTWDVVREILQDTTAQLRDDGFAFETVAFVEGYDVPPLLLGVRHDDGPVL